MAKPGKCGKEGGTLQQWVARCLSQTVQFIYGQVFPTAFLTLNALNLCSNINRQIAINESLLQCGFEYGEISGCCVLRDDTFYHLPVGRSIGTYGMIISFKSICEKRMVSPFAKIFNSSCTRFQLMMMESELWACLIRCTWSKYSMKFYANAPAALPVRIGF